MGLVYLTDAQTKKIQIDEGIVVFNLGETGEKIIGPCRGGAEFTATPTIRDIEYDGRKGKTKGLQVKDEEEVILKIITLDCSQDMLQKAIPNAVVDTTSGKISQGDFGLIKTDNYIGKVSIITKTLDGKFKILNVKNVMHEGAFSFKTVSKSENEHNLELVAHYDYTTDTKLWDISEADTNPIAS